MSPAATNGRGQRRSSLLGALEQLLRRGPLDSIKVSQIASLAGVTRSAFYFYFDNVPTAVAALVQEMYDDSRAATRNLVHGKDPAPQRIATTIDDLLRSWREHLHLHRAMLDARDQDPSVRALWNRDRESFVPDVASVIVAQRSQATGETPDPDEAKALAAMLLELNDRALERLSRDDTATEQDAEQVRHALLTIWLRTIYGSSDVIDSTGSLAGPGWPAGSNAGRECRHEERPAS